MIIDWIVIGFNSYSRQIFFFFFFFQSHIIKNYKKKFKENRNLIFLFSFYHSSFQFHLSIIFDSFEQSPSVSFLYTFLHQLVFSQSFPYLLL